jgi:hypothetical protein
MVPSQQRQIVGAGAQPSSLQLTLSVQRELLCFARSDH